jgi:hypothetical protein
MGSLGSRLPRTLTPRNYIEDCVRSSEREKDCRGLLFIIDQGIDDSELDLAYDQGIDDSELDLASLTFKFFNGCCFYVY